MQSNTSQSRGRKKLTAMSSYRELFLNQFSHPKEPKKPLIPDRFSIAVNLPKRSSNVFISLHLVQTHLRLFWLFYPKYWFWHTQSIQETVNLRPKKPLKSILWRKFDGWKVARWPEFLSTPIHYLTFGMSLSVHKLTRFWPRNQEKSLKTLNKL